MINSHEMQQQQNVQQQQNQQQSQQNQQQTSNQAQQQGQQQPDNHSQQVAQQMQSQQQQMQQVPVQQQNQQQSQQQANGQHNVTQVQVQSQQVAASMPQQLQNAVAVSMQHQQQQPGVSMALAGQQGATTITTMAAHPQAVQVIQQPMQSQAYHVQQLYNPQGTPLMIPGNLALHPAGLNPSSIQVITAGKPFSSAAQLTPHMLTTASTPGQPGNHGGPGGKVQGFPAGYLPVPTSGNPGGGQTLVFSPLGVLGSTQSSQSLQQQQQQQQQGTGKPDQVQKYTTCAASNQSTTRGGGMQFAPWQFTTPVWTGIQPPGTTLLAAPNQIFIRNSQPEMYIHGPQALQTHNALAASQQQIQGVQQIAAASGKPRVMDIQQQQQPQNKQGSSGQRPLSILPSLQGVQGQNIRPASSVSTQTVHGVQTTSGKGSGSGGKGRGKPVVRTSPGTNASQGATKADAANQTKSNVHHATMIMQHQPNATNNSGNGSKVLITTNSPVVTSAQPPGSPMSTADKQNFGQQNKTVMQSPQQQQQQVQQQGQPTIQPQYQHMFMQQMQQIQHQQQLHQYQQAQAQNSQPQLQPKPVMGMTLQSSGQQQGVAPGVVLGSDRPIMPVVSMGVGVATTLQMGQVQQPSMPAVQQLPLPTLNPALIGNQMVSSAPQVQAMSMLAQTGEVPPPPQPDNNPSTPMVVAPERNQQNECSVMVQQCASTPVANEESGASPKKDEEAKETRESAPNSQEAESNKITTKEESSSLPPKIEEKLFNNPLANLANAVNSITNGIVEEPAVSINTPISTNKQALPKALVKPQVLTHVIEGFVIQEASEPFVVNRPTLNGSVTQESMTLNKNNNFSDKDNHEEPPKKKHSPNHSNESEANNAFTGKCEACGNTFDEHTTKFKKDRRFCSSICAKSKKKESRDRDTDKQWSDMEVDGKKSDDSGKKTLEDRIQTPVTPTEDMTPRINPVKWTVNEVCEFIRNLPGCSDYAEDFAIQEIDGQALMLLKEDHLMSAMSIKLGPALKIVAKIDSMRIDNSVTTSPSSNSS